jgi:hypothetical protein
MKEDDADSATAEATSSLKSITALLEDDVSGDTYSIELPPMESTVESVNFEQDILQDTKNDKPLPTPPSDRENVK